MNEEIVFQLIINLRPSKTMGSDGLYPRLLSSLANII